ncbi:hypothetical protein M427DRAFT_31100 [Gonapodya prolifera JEL478]|uniref:Uncharacterized protein n=1 Tax=Gonapodya prolifera (strain JEL478) TaxID=1344416 RepID=A0A139AIS0_GONPJ|nr:hypothetical protein M427DRAFT_31100 [Gonapodya prolifera JEL478]|eukprot:KXS16702.1 hypothetical protein M427DRAFT_31100 [Gonapodya prolifera JEL478]
MPGGASEPQGDREPDKVSDLDYLLAYYKKYLPKKQTQSDSSDEDGTKPPAKRPVNARQKRNVIKHTRYCNHPAVPCAQPEPLEMNIEASESHKPVVIENTDYGADPNLYVDHVACKNAQIQYHQYTPPMTLAAVRRTVRTTAEMFTMVTTKEMLLPAGLGTLTTVTPLEHHVHKKLEGANVCILANPILTARDNLSVPNSFCHVKDGVVAVGIENWSDRPARPKDAEPVLEFDRQGILMTAMANPTLGTACDDIDGLDLSTPYSLTSK